MQQISNQTSINQQEIEIALSVLQNSLIIMYYRFEIVCKIVGLVLLAYISYRIGKKSVSEPLVNLAKKIEKEIEEIQNQKQLQPIKIKKLSTIYQIIIILCTVLFLIIIGAIYQKLIKVDSLFLLPFLILPFLFYIARNLHISYVKSKSKKFTEQESKIKQKIIQLNHQLGQKVQKKLTNILCKNKLQLKQPKSSQCTKKQCQQLRQNLKVRSEAIKNFARLGLQFEWCSTCRKKSPFNQLLKFQVQALPAHNDDISQQADADLKITYLLKLLDDINQWIKEADPCNCSKLYMEYILKGRKQCDKILKQCQPKIKQFQPNQQKTLSANLTSNISSTTTLSKKNV